jgi:putative membrane protein
MTLAILFLAVAAVFAIAPYDRHDWLLENALTVIFAVVLVASYRHLPLSRVSYTLIFLFLCLHEVGAHYTYAKVPTTPGPWP